MAAINLPALPDDPPRTAILRACYRHLDVLRADLPPVKLSAFIDDLTGLLEDAERKPRLCSNAEHYADGPLQKASSHV